jgi:hypothetical protein
VGEVEVLMVGGKAEIEVTTARITVTRCCCSRCARNPTVPKPNTESLVPNLLGDDDVVDGDDAGDDAEFLLNVLFV